MRLVAPFDNILLSHASRTRVISDEHRKRLFSGKNGVFPGTVLVDGFVAGTWEFVGTGEATSIMVTRTSNPTATLWTRSRPKVGAC